ncbi:MAG: hypothetical protein IKV10_00690 [Alphaproteobacteria bacterium]|nr:hypothetical protein [Alphaproteobacteria bacterium]
MRLTIGILLSLTMGVAHASTDLTAAIENVRTACGGIGAELNDMKKMAGITTAVTGVGTVMSGVALGSGLTKAKTDAKIATITVSDELYAQLNEFEQQLDASEVVESTATTASTSGGTQPQSTTEDEAKSKKLGNIRTGTLATATVTNIAGAIMSGTNKVKGDLKSQIAECLLSVKTLSNARMQAHLEKSADQAELNRADRIISACDGWSVVDIDPINNRSAGATVSSGIGATTGLIGTAVSASANSTNVRDGDDQKEKNLNTTANVLAGATTVASGAATIFNATQINAIKRAAKAADECEGALK